MDKQLGDIDHDRYFMHPMLHNLTKNIIAALIRGNMTVPVLLEAVAKAVKVYEESKEKSNIEKLLEYAKGNKNNG